MSTKWSLVVAQIEKLDRKASRARVEKLYGTQAIVNAYVDVYYRMLGLTN